MKQHKTKIIISGGGSGGHVFPAIAIANALKESIENVEILFVGAIGKMEMEKVPAAGYRIEGLWISGLQRRLTFKNLSFPFKLLYSLYKAKKIIKEFKPDLAIGVGGFASGPLLQMASKLGIPCMIQEQNSYPGITNILLSKKVDKICVAYDGLEKYFPEDKIYLTGNPVRKDVVQIENKKVEASNFFSLNIDKPTVLVVGGSLGARTINEAIEHNLSNFTKNGIQLIWQTGINYFPTAQSTMMHHPDNGLKVLKFINRMDLAYAMADIVISRAGAIAISELCIVGKPTILVPSPFVAEDHQTKNALALFTYNAAILVKDVELKTKLWKELFALLNDSERQNKLSENIYALAKLDATNSIVAVAKTLFK
ncbi:MAG: undecaprenyldiphospho-muramoylpentapeptide beta-N-acetylglucosaminyltransferase [Bacteroidetes bacterium CG2_30_33_31]|nr:MAG: undecaprenyldiphospho-muramoylpentapeptide beta-N-acetylglucosaminyltransferase [Bacteroidetes bacterium CG2_30_33_31]